VGLVEKTLRKKFEKTNPQIDVCCSCNRRQLKSVINTTDVNWGCSETIDVNLTSPAVT